MSFDLSRIRFDPRQDFLGVVMQQGRVQLDADWNAWLEQLARRLQAGTLDTFNGSVVPRITPDGFRIQAAGGSLTIGPGRMYVDGLLAENHGRPPDEWDERLAELTGTDPIGYDEQPYYPEPEPLPQGAGPHLVFLDVWQREVTSVEDPTLIEQAVGVDTAGRLQTVWQVRVLPNVGDGVTCATPDQDIEGWLAETAPSAGRLSTDTGDPVDEPSPCEVPPAAGYRGLENQLYRVEVHTGGPLGTATFKWSRDNATVAARITHINPSRDVITVESLGRDDVLAFHEGEWVEVTDDLRELHRLPGELRRIAPAGGIDRTARTLTLDSPLSAGIFPTDGQQATEPARNTRVRRWDQAEPVRDDAGNPVGLNDGEIEIPPAGTRLFLEHGILVEFSLASDGGEFRTGDHWVFAARTADASIEILDEAPPLGIHHHYARLAVVSFPESETDCRTLWPPLSEGESCDCTVCVTAAGHNGGTATIQQAIDSVIGAGGGTICLGIGTYQIRETLSIDDARSLRIRGQGWRTVLVGQQTGTILNVSGGIGVKLENLSVVGTGGTSGVTPVIAARGVADLGCIRVNVLGLGAGDGIAVGLGMSGLLLRATVSECAIFAQRGIAFVQRDDDDSDYLLTAELRIARNAMICARAGVSLPGLSLHYGTTRVDYNLILAGTEGAVIATGGCFPGSSFAISGNVIATQSDGVRGGVDNLTVEGNEISGMQERSGDGIVLEEGVDAVALDRVRIHGNRISGMQGNAVVVNQRIETAILSENFIDGMGLAAFVMARAASAGDLRFAGNRCSGLGRGIGASQNAFAAVQLVRVENGDVLDNLIADVAREAVASAAVSAIRAVGVTRVRVAGNRIHDIGPDRGGQIAGIRITPPFDRVAVDDNAILRLADENAEANVVAWSAINVTAEAIIAGAHFAAASYILADAESFVLTANRLAAVANRPSALSVRGNQLEGTATNVPLTRAGLLDHCLFNGNTCETRGQTGPEPTLGLISAQTITLSDNRLRSVGDLQTMHLQPGFERAIVIGNTSTGPINVLGGAPVPPDIGLTNMFNV